MKTCKQCGRTLDDSYFRKTKPRGRGIYKTTQGSNTMCKDCESLNVRAHNALKKIEAGIPVDTTVLKQHYQRLSDAGHPPVTAAARRLMGLESATRGRETNGLLLNNDLMEHIAKVRDRSYSSFDEADAMHRQLESRLREAGMYDMENEMLEAWYDET